MTVKKHIVNIFTQFIINLAFDAFNHHCISSLLWGQNLAFMHRLARCHYSYSCCWWFVFSNSNCSSNMRNPVAIWLLGSLLFILFLSNLKICKIWINIIFSAVEIHHVFRWVLWYQICCQRCNLVMQGQKIIIYLSLILFIKIF